MPVLRPYADRDWDAVLDLCLLAFGPACESLERHQGIDLRWRTSLRAYLRSLTRPVERKRLVVAELRGSVVGIVHYQIDARAQSGSIGVSAVHPARQGRGIASLMYRHVLDAMRAQGLKYATADAAANSSHAPLRRAYEKAGFVAEPTVHYFMELRAASVSRARPARRRRSAAAS